MKTKYLKARVELITEVYLWEVANNRLSNRLAEWDWALLRGQYHAAEYAFNAREYRYADL